MFVFYVCAGVLLGILIIVHEIGHFLAARASGVTVERFSIGFGPRILRVRRGKTEYALSLIPLGGYVKMAGAGGLPGDSGSEPLGRDTFQGSPMWARAFIVASGPVANFAWAVLVYIAVIWVVGMPMFGEEPIIGYVDVGSPAEAAGLQVMDWVLSVEGEKIETWEDLRTSIASADTDDGIEFLVERGEEETQVPLVVFAAPDPETGAVTVGVASYIAPLVGDVMRGSPADLAGLETGDRVTRIDEAVIRTWYELSEIISDSPNEELEIVWDREGVEMRALVVPEEIKEPVGTSETRTVGSIGTMVPLTMRKVGLGEAIATGVALSVSTLRQIVKFFRMMLTCRLSLEMLGGPIRVIQMASESARWGASYFFAFMAFLSLNLCVINLLPLPILDGGHLLLLLLEKLRGRGLTERQLLVWQQVGLVFFVGLLALLLIRDAIWLR